MHTSGVNFPTFQQLAPHTHHPQMDLFSQARQEEAAPAAAPATLEEQEEIMGRTLRSAAEAVEVARATAQQAEAQSRQLHRADHLADEGRYVLDLSARTLRNLSWSGWVANRFTRNLRREDYVGPQQSAGPQRSAGIPPPPPSGGGENSRPGVGVPPRYRDASDAVRSYRRHVALLAEGGPPVPAADGGRREAAEALCEELAARARAALREAGGGGGGGGGLEGNGGAYDRIEADLAEAERARALLFGGPAGGSRRRRRRPPSAAAAGGAAPAPAPAPAPAASSGGSGSGSASSRLRVQDAHLDALSSNLVELAGIGEALGTSFASQAVLVDALADKSDALAERTKEVRRRAERRAAAARWVRERPTLTGGWVTVRHAASGLYLRCESRGATVALGPPDPDGGGHVFGVWSRRGSAVVGLRGRRTRTYLGQSLLGYLVCSAARYGRAEEWELDGDASGPGGGVAILCVGANWGSGGWLEANPAAGTVQVGGSSGPAARKRAALWRVDQVEAGGDS